jgi:hypothetical protein
MIEFECNQCSKRLKVKDEAAGKKGKCPQCGVLLEVPQTVAESVAVASAEKPAAAATEPPVVSGRSLDRQTPPGPAAEDVDHEAGSPGSDLDLPIKIGMAVGGVGLLVLALSPLFKWINFGAGGVTGISGDGKIVLGVTVVCAILFALVAFARKRLVPVSLGVGAWGIVALFWMGALIWKVGSITDSPEIKDNPFAAIFATQVSPGAGLYLGLIGGLIVAGALGFLAFRRLQQTNRLKLFYIVEPCALVLGLLVAIAVGPERTAEAERGNASPASPASPMSFIERTEPASADRRNHRAVEEIEGLRAKLAAEKQDVLSRFVIERSRFTRSETGFGSDNVIELSVRNDTGRAVSRAYFHAVLLTPGREMPWVDDDFNYQITGGLEPGEMATWRLSPNMFGMWGNAPSDRDDLVFIVRPVRLDGADGESITGERFTKDDTERLRALLDTTDYGNAAEVRRSLQARDEAVRQWRATAVNEALRAEAQHLRELKAQYDAAQASMAKFEVVRSRFYFSKDQFSSDPVIDLTVRNGTGQAISRFYCRGVLSSPGRETPWVDDTFNYSVRGGIQPGETKQFQLSPNMFGPWGKAPKDRQDMVFAVTVYRIDGSDENELYPAEWTEDDAARLASVERMIHAVR